MKRNAAISICQPGDIIEITITMNSNAQEMHVKQILCRVVSITDTKLMFDMSTAFHSQVDTIPLAIITSITIVKSFTKLEIHEQANKAYDKYVKYTKIPIKENV